MLIYNYNKSENHKSSDTDKYILKSVSEYAKNQGIVISENLTVSRTIFGKPYVNVENIYIGVTHTDNLLIIAIDNKEFGIDCEEKNRQVKNKEAIVKRYFTKHEQCYVENCSERFLEIWVKKEAYIKFLGTGFKDILKADTFKVCGVYKEIEFKNYIIYTYNE